MFTREYVKRELKNKGWSYRAAAAASGRTYQHISDVLNGHRQSLRLLCVLHALPPRPRAHHQAHTLTKETHEQTSR
jgi:hypothetical protein